jgi:hypothetical protein
MAAGSATTTLDQEVTIANHRLGSVRALVNVINLVRQFDNLNQQQTSLLLRDPYPEHASNALNRAGKSIVGLLRTETIPASAATVLASSVVQGLRIVRQISFTAAQALDDLAILFRENGLQLQTDYTPHDAAGSATLPIALDSAVTPEMLENETLRELGQQAVADPSLVLKSIERHEGYGSTPDFGLDYLQYIDFSAVARDWDFEDVFACE